MKLFKTLRFSLIGLLAVALLSSVSSVEAFQPLPNSLAWEVINQSGTPVSGTDLTSYNVSPGQTVNLSLTIKNWSRNPAAQVWYGTSALLSEGSDYPYAHAIGVGTWNPRDNVPSFIDSSSFVIHGNRLAYYNGPEVGRGGQIVLSWSVKLKSDIRSGAYDLDLALVREFDEWGQRVDGQGKPHRFQSVRYRFNVSDDGSTISNIDESTRYYIAGTTVDGYTTYCVKDSQSSSKECLGKAMPQDMALDISSEGVNGRAPLNVIQNPRNSAEYLFTTYVYQGPENYAIPTAATTRIYGYDVNSQLLEKYYTYEEDDGNAPLILNMLGTTSDRLLLYSIAAESSPGICWNPWLDNSRFQLTLTGDHKLSSYTPPAWKMEQERAEWPETCPSV
jgi:hypothetical protein